MRWVCRSLYPVDVLLSSIRGRFRSFGVEAGSYPCRQHAISRGRPLESSWSFRSCYCSPYLHAAKVLTSLLTRNWCFLHCRLLLCSRRSLLARCKDVRRQVVTIVNTSTRPKQVGCMTELPPRCRDVQEVSTLLKTSGSALLVFPVSRLLRHIQLLSRVCIM